MKYKNPNSKSNGKANAILAQNKKNRSKAFLKRVLASFLVVFCLAAAGGGGVYAYLEVSVDTGVAGEIPAEFATGEHVRGDVVNILVAGLDYETEREGERGGSADSYNTDLLMYVHYDMVNNAMSIFQIPRDMFIGEEYDTGDNYRINAVYAQADEGEKISELVSVIYDNFKLPVDYFVTIDMEAFIGIVDAIGGVEMYMPVDIVQPDTDPPIVLYNAGETALVMGEQAEIVVRSREYPNADIDRLSVQRYFYGALFQKFLSFPIGDIVKLLPYYLSFVNTDMDLVTTGLIARQAMAIEPQNILIAKLPGEGFMYKGESVYTGHLEQTSQILNDYFRTYQDPVPVEELGMIEYQNTTGWLDGSVQYMDGILAQEEITR